MMCTHLYLTLIEMLTFDTSICLPVDSLTAGVAALVVQPSRDWGWCLVGYRLQTVSTMLYVHSVHTCHVYLCSVLSWLLDSPIHIYCTFIHLLIIGSFRLTILHSRVPRSFVSSVATCGIGTSHCSRPKKLPCGMLVMLIRWKGRRPCLQCQSRRWLTMSCGWRELTTRPMSGRELMPQK